MVLDPNSGASSQGPGRRKIGFFDLPRSVRDNIYDSVYETTDLTSSAHERKYWLTPFLMYEPVPRVRLVSRQFKAEYDQVFPPKSSKVQATQPLKLHCYESSELSKSIPFCGRSCTHLHLSVDCSITCDCWYNKSPKNADCESRRCWGELIESVSEVFDQLESISITLFADPAFCLDVLVLRAQQELPLASMDVISADEQLEKAGRRLFLCRWSKERGWFMGTELNPYKDKAVVAKALLALGKNIRASCDIPECKGCCCGIEKKVTETETALAEALEAKGKVETALAEALEALKALEGKHSTDAALGDALEAKANITQH